MKVNSKTNRNTSENPIRTDRKRQQVEKLILSGNLYGRTGRQQNSKMVRKFEGPFHGNGEILIEIC